MCIVRYCSISVKQLGTVLSVTIQQLEVVW